MQQQQQRPLAKRSACDRCRQQKLRCLRLQDQSDGPCVRCARADAFCVTGAPKPLGRSRTGGANDTRKERASRRPRHSVFLSVQVPKAALQVSPASVPDEEAETATAPAQELASLSPPAYGSSSFGRFHNTLMVDPQLSSMFFDDGLSNSEITDAVIDTLDFGLLVDSATLWEPVTVSNPGAFVMESDFHELHVPCGKQAALMSLPDLSSTSNFNICLDANLLRQSPPGSALEVLDRSLEPSHSLTNVLGRVSRLNESISHQISRMETFVLGTPPPSLIRSCVDKVGDLQVNHILGAFESTSELAAIIKQVISAIQGHESSPLIMPVVLMCLSAHIQLLQIYNTIFFRVHRVLNGMHDIFGFFEKLPSFTHMSGLTPIKGDLYIKIAVQVAQHNISSVERVMGLPAELCLSAQQPLSKNLLSYVDSPESFHNIMYQACDSSENSGRALVVSLRSNIGSVLGLLRDGT